MEVLCLHPAAFTLGSPIQGPATVPTILCLQAQPRQVEVVNTPSCTLRNVLKVKL